MSSDFEVIWRKGDDKMPNCLVMRIFGQPPPTLHD